MWGRSGPGCWEPDFSCRASSLSGFLSLSAYGCAPKLGASGKHCVAKDPPLREPLPGAKTPVLVSCLAISVLLLSTSAPPLWLSLG